MGKWIRVPQPALVLNAADAPGWPYRMWYNRKVPKGKSAKSIIDDVVSTALRCGRSELKALIINCHAEPAKLGLGQGFSRSNVSLFDNLYVEGYGPLVKRIYLIACEIAKVKGESREGGGFATRDGNLFCCAMCKNAHAEVVAPRVMQHQGSEEPPVNHIDRFEGVTYLYSPPRGSNRVIK